MTCKFNPLNFDIRSSFFVRMLPSYDQIPQSRGVSYKSHVKTLGPSGIQWNLERRPHVSLGESQNQCAGRWPMYFQLFRYSFKIGTISSLPLRARRVLVELLSRRNGNCAAGLQLFEDIVALCRVQSVGVLNQLNLVFKGSQGTFTVV